MTSGPAAAISSGIHALRRSAGNDRKFSLGNRFHMGPLLYHIKDVMFYRREQIKGNQIVIF